MSKIERFENIEVWKKASDLTREIYEATHLERFVRFLRYALRSRTEVQSHLYVALDEGYINRDAFDSLCNQADKVRSIISDFIRYLKELTMDVGHWTLDSRN